MGESVNKDHFTDKDYALFQARLDKETAFVRQLFSEKQFDNQTRKLGYELELCLLNDDGSPSPSNQQVLDQAGNNLFTHELAKFNLEINGNAFKLSPDVFQLIEDDLSTLYQQVETAADECKVRAGLFGVLPSIDQEHLDAPRYMTDQFRYRLLDHRIMEMRERPVQLEINGADRLVRQLNGVMLEALSTSLQTHIQVPFDESVDCYHAALWSSLAVLGAGANSPLVMGKVGWQESRIAIFKQAVDTRNLKELEDAIIPRVHFGKKYISSWLDLFEDNSYYSPILPDARDTDVKVLHHFNMHNGTIWRWVRPILGVTENQYHLRLELRVSPSGPTQIDTMANMIFSIGLLEGLREAGNLTQVPFEQLEQDFYRVAREGLMAPITWCDGQTGNLRDILLSKAIPLAAKGLASLGIVHYDKWLNVIEGRVASGQTGSDWILGFWQKSKNTRSLVNTYLDHASQNIPVHEWPDPSA